MAAEWIKAPTEQRKRTLNSPPADVAPSALLARLQDTPRPNERNLPFPRKDDDGNPIGTFAFWALMQEEIDLCRADAGAYADSLVKRDKDNNAPNQRPWSENYESAVLVEVLFRTLRDNEDLNKPLFRSPDEIRHFLADDEIVHLYEAYSAMQQRRGPLFRVLTEDELEEWIDVLAKGADQYPFELCSRGQLVALVVSFASQMREWQIGKFSSGSDTTDGAETPSKKSEAE